MKTSIVFFPPQLCLLRAKRQLSPPAGADLSPAGRPACAAVFPGCKHPSSARVNPSVQPLWLLWRPDPRPPVRTNTPLRHPNRVTESSGRSVDANSGNAGKQLCWVNLDAILGITIQLKTGLVSALVHWYQNWYRKKCIWSKRSWLVRSGVKWNHQVFCLCSF